MDRRRFVATLGTGVVGTAGCAVGELLDPQPTVEEAENAFRDLEETYDRDGHALTGAATLSPGRRSSPKTGSRFARFPCSRRHGSSRDSGIAGGDALDFLVFEPGEFATYENGHEARYVESVSMLDVENEAAEGWGRVPDDELSRYLADGTHRVVFDNTGYASASPSGEVEVDFPLASDRIQRGVRQ